MKKLALLLGVGLVLGSCTVYHDIQLTGQPMGTKEGVAKSKVFGGDYSIKTAAENGDITTIGAVETKTKVYLIFPISTTRVYGK